MSKVYLRLVVDDGEEKIGAEVALRDGTYDLADNVCVSEMAGNALHDVLERIDTINPYEVLCRAVKETVLNHYPPGEQKPPIHVETLFGAVIYFEKWIEKYISINSDPLMSPEDKRKRLKKLETEFEPFKPGDGLNPFEPGRN